jgi:type I restriction enzyme R subunit
MAALEIFKRDIQTYLRVYAFLSQIFDYGNTDIEKRWIFFRYLVRLLDFGREREGVDLSKVVLTHHKLASRGETKLSPGFNDGDAKLHPITETGSGQVRDKEKLRLDELIARVNDLFEGELSDGDKLVYVNNVIKGKLLESATLAQQARHNTKEQFANSPDLSDELTNAVMDAMTAHSAMSKQALENDNVKKSLKEILLGPGRLWEMLREEEYGSAER